MGKRCGWRAVVAAWVLSCVAACELDPTQLVVVVNTDYEVGTDLTEIIARAAEAGSDGEPEERLIGLTSGEATATTVRVPFSFAVTPPGGDATRNVRIEVEASGSGVAGTHTQSVVTAFVEHRSLLVPMFLWKQCGGVECLPGETCDASSGEARCVPNAVPASTLQTAVPGRETEADAAVVTDAGSGPDGGPDAQVDGGVDAAVDASGVPDAGVPSTVRLPWMEERPASGDMRLFSVWAVAPDDVYAVGFEGTPDQGVVLRNRGVDWVSMDLSAVAPVVQLNGVWAASATSVFVVGDFGTVLHYDGSAWTRLDAGVTYNLVEVSGSAADDVYVSGLAIGQDTLRYDGRRWRATSAPHPFSSLWCLGDRDLLASSGSGEVWRYQAGTWSRVGPARLPTSTALAVWGSSGSDVHAANRNGIWTFDGADWRVTYAGGRWVEHVWGVSSSEVYAVGRDGVLRFDGSEWHWESGGAPRDSSYGDRLYEVAGAGGHVVAVGRSGGIIRRF